jgi:O-antigen ligase
MAKAKTQPAQSTLSTILLWLIAGVSAIALAWNLALRPEETVIWSIVALTVALVSAKLKRGIYLIIFLPVIGELVRLPFGPENGILISDLAVLIFLALWLYKKSKSGEAFPKDKITTPLIVFYLVAALSLFASLTFLSLNEVIAGSLYLVRLIGYISLFLIVRDQTAPPGAPDEIESKIAHTSARAEASAPKASAPSILKALFASAFLIASAGFVQLFVYPDMTRLEEYGWDPHINRLVSTWLDPNFIGGYFAFIICIALGILLCLPKKSAAPHLAAAARTAPHSAAHTAPAITAAGRAAHFSKLSLLTLIAILTTALFLTYSRSAYLALAAGIIVISVLKNWKILVIGTVIFAVGIAVSPRADQRLGELYQTAESIIFNTSQNPDPTARLRIKAYEQTWELVSMRPLLGSGYNTLRYTNVKEGFVENSQIHSAGGSDSSLLTVLAATGILGFIPFIAIFIMILSKLWAGQKPPAASTINRPPAAHLQQGFNLGMLGGTIALLIHSLFVNSLLFAPIMIPFWIVYGLISNVETNPTSSQTKENRAPR